MDSVIGALGSIGGIVAAGPIGWIIAGVLVVGLIVLYVIYIKHKNKAALNASHKEGDKAQGEVVPQNQKQQTEWEKAEEAARNAKKDRS